MSEMSNEAIQVQIATLKADEAVKIAVGDDVITAAGGAVTASSVVYADSGSDFATNAITASKLLYADANKVPQTGNLPFEIVHSGVANTASAIVEYQANSTLTANHLMHGTFVAGAQVTTFTKTGFIRVKITDDGGNLTDGYHYIQIGSLS